MRGADRFLFLVIHTPIAELCALPVFFPRQRDSLVDQLAQGRPMHVFQRTEIEASFAQFVFAELAQKISVPRVAAHDIEGQGLLPGRKSRQEPIRFPSAFIDIVTVAEPDDAWSPQFGLGTGSLPHQFHDRLAIPASLLIRDRIKEF